MSNKIRILNMFGEPISYGGEESVVFNIIQALGFDDFHFDLFTPYFVNNEKIIEYIKQNNANIYSLNIEAKINDNRFLLEKDIDNFLKEHHNYDIIHIHSGSLSTMCVFSKIAKKYGIKKVIVHSHSAGIKENVIHKAQKYFLNIILQKNADYYLACSQNAAIWKFSSNALKNTHIIYNGIDKNLFLFNNDYRNEIRNKYNVGNNFLLGSVGRLAFPKNQKFCIDLFIECLKYNHNLLLMLVGDGPDATFLENYSKEKNVFDKIIFVKKTNEIYKYYSAFDTFLMPSEYEGLGLTAVEAQFAKCPALLSNMVDKEVGISNSTAFLQLNDITKWVKLILDIKNNQEKYNKNNIAVNYNKFDRNYTFEYIKNIYLN